MVQDEWVLLTFSSEKGRAEISRRLRRHGCIAAYQVFCFTPTLHKAEADFTVGKEKIVKIGNQFAFLTGDWEH